GQKGEEIYRKLVGLVNPRQVFLLENDATIMQALSIYSSLVNIHICVCGGDGTVSWVLNRLIDFFPSLENPPVSIYPLGTGNDLSRVLGWGYQYDPKRLLRVLAQIPDAQPVALDCWQIKFETLEMAPTTPNDESSFAHQDCSFFLNRPKFVRNANELKGHRIAQCSQVCLELSRPMPVQMDGEPFYLVEPAIVNIIYTGQVNVLRN
ncbi:unnamed protein product, partial [Rotaria sp. Silwood1]